MTDWKKIKKNLKDVGEILVDSAKEIRKGVEEEIREKQLDEKFKKAKDTLAEKLEDIGEEVSNFIASIKEEKAPESSNDSMQELLKAVEKVTIAGDVLRKEKESAKKNVDELTVQLNSAKQDYDYYSEKLEENRKLAEKLNNIVLSQNYSELDSILSELKEEKM